MDCSTPGRPVHHQLLELKLMSIELVMPPNHLILSHPLLLPSIFPSIRVSSNESIFRISRNAKELEFPLQHQSFQWIFRTDFLQDWLIESPFSSRDSQESSPTPQSKNINSSVLSFLCSPTFTFIHDYWKNHSFDYTNLCWQSNASVFNILSRLVIAFPARASIF